MLLDDLATETTITGLFHQQVIKYPEKVAIRHQDRTLSYRELDSYANSLARSLISKGVKKGDIVAISSARRPELIISIIAILKCGAAYMPIDKNDPVARLEKLLQIAKVKIGISDHAIDEALSDSREWISTEDITTLDESDMNLVSDSDDKCYVMFTSGSTGTPKGVVVPHRAVVRLVNQPNFIDISSDQVFIQFSPLTFDASTFEIWGALLNGAELVLYSGDAFDPKRFSRELETYGVSVLWLTAALFHLVTTRFISLFKPVKVLLAGGDVLYPKSINAVLDKFPDIKIINGYGPTENTTFTCCHVMTTENRPGDTVPIGKPISGTDIYILGENGNLVEDGEVGELHAGGAGVALGYLGVDSSDKVSFYQRTELSDNLLYNTGDLVRKNAQGEIEFIGRRDHQVKIRGFRVSVEEIRTAITQLSGVTDAMVLVDKQESGDQQLIAYIQLDLGDSQTVSDIKDSLKLELPKYMIPDLIHLNQELPINKNGKIDGSRIRQINAQTQASVA